MFIFFIIVILIVFCLAFANVISDIILVSIELILYFDEINASVPNMEMVTTI